MITSTSPLLRRQSMRQGDAPLVRAAIEDENGAPIVAAQISSLSYKIFDTTSNTAAPTLIASGALDKTECWYDTWQPWKDDEIGFNFAHRFAASLFATVETGNRQFKFEVAGIMAVTLEPFWAVFMLVNAEDALGS